MGNPSFKLNNLKEVENFEQSLTIFYNANSQFILWTYFDLVKCYEKFLNLDDGARIFTSIFDIKLNLIMLDFDLQNLIQSYGKWINNRNDDLNVFNNPNFLNDSLRSLGFASNYIVRYRAIWDKIMTLLVLTYKPSEIQKLRRKKKSRKQNFKEIFQDIKHPLSINIESLISFINSFDEDFRTPEVHDTGKLRKWIFKGPNIGRNHPYFKLTEYYWNNLIYMVSEIDSKILKKD